MWTWLPQQGLADGVPFLIILVTMTLRRAAARRARRRPARCATRRSGARPGRWPRPCIVFVLGVVVLVLLHGSLRAAFMASIVTVCLALGLVVLTGYVGQVSLAQMSFAGVGAFVLTHIGQHAGLPFLGRADRGGARRSCRWAS